MTELLIWHAGLGCDDEQATDAEVRAGVLYAFPAREEQTHALRGLHMMQALLAFARSLDSRGAKGPRWLSVTLSKRLFVIEEVEDQVYMALGVAPARTMKDATLALRHVLKTVYDMFCLFHGKITAILRRIGTQSSVSDGMKLLLRIRDVRKHLRKVTLALENRDDNALNDATATEQEGLKQSLSRELEELEEISPVNDFRTASHSFFPILLNSLDCSNLSVFQVMDGINYFPMDPTTFLSLQSFVTALTLEFKSEFAGCSIFYKGNLLWNNLPQRQMHLLLKFLRFREEKGMELDGQEIFKNPSETTLWMTERYLDTFSPIWASKRSYAECEIARHFQPEDPDSSRHPRKQARSLHRTSSGSLSAILGSQKESFESSNDQERAKSADQALKRALKARAASVSFRNVGFLLRNGYFARAFESNEQTFPEGPAVGGLDVWAARMYDLDDEECRSDHPNYGMVWHESDMTLVVKVKSPILPTDPRWLGRLENFVDKLQFAQLAKLLGGGSETKSDHGSSSKRFSMAPSSSSSASSSVVFAYMNHVNLAFRVHQVPRLIRSNGEDDMYPVPRRLYAHYFPQASLDYLNALHSLIHKYASGNCEVGLKTVSDGWVYGTFTHVTAREVFGFFDTKVASTTDLMDAVDQLFREHFANVLF